MPVTTHSIPYPHIAARVFNTPLMVHPAKLDAIIAGLGSRLLGRSDLVLPSHGASTGEMFSTRKADRSPNGYRIDNGVAVINVSGALVHRSQFVSADSTYLLGYDTVATDLDNALSDADVHAIALVFDSPGGEVSGAFELADRIYAARAQKRIVAIADELAASAAYLTGSAADELVISGTGMVGSVGVVTRHVDMSRALANDGIEVTHIYAGAHKIDGNPFEPLPASVRADFQAEIDSVYADFVAAVERHRGMSAEAVRGTEARMYRADDAIRIGLADRRASTDQIIAELADNRPRRVHGPRAQSAKSRGEHGMKDENQGAGLDSQPAKIYTQADLDAQVATSRAEGEAAGRVAGATAERERIRAVEEQSMAGHEALIETLKFDGSTTGPEAAAAVLSAHKAGLAERREQMHKAAPPVIPSAEEPAAQTAAVDSRALAAAAQDLVASERAAGRTITVAQAMQRLTQEA